MRYAVIAPTAAGTTADPAWISAWTRHVERCGFDEVVLVEHSVCDEADRAGRDPARIGLALGHLVTRIDQGRAERLAALGADRIVLAGSATVDLEEARDELSACAERLGIAP
jgi:hypothetical protein